MMSSGAPSKSLSDCWQVAAKSLKAGKLPEDALVLQKFLYESIDFVASFKGAGEAKKAPALEEWLGFIKELLPAVVDQHVTWTGKGLKYSTVLVYLNHLLYQVAEARLLCIEPFKLLASAMFSLLCQFIFSEENSQLGLVPDLAEKTYSLLCAAGQRVQKSELCSYHAALRIYELYFLAAACLNLDSTNAGRDGMKTAKDFMASYFHMCSEWKPKALSAKAPKSLSVKENSEEDTPLGIDYEEYVTDLVEIAVRAYTAQPRDLLGDNSLAYFLDIIRISKAHLPLSRKLLACDGDLFKYEVKGLLLTFSNQAFENLKAQNHKKSVYAQFPEDNDAKATVMSLLHLSQILAESDRNGGGGSKQLDGQLAEHSYFDATVQYIGKHLDGSNSKLVSSSVCDALSLLLKTLPERNRHLWSAGVLRLCYRLSSLAVRALAMDVLKHAGRAGQEMKLRHKIYDLVVTCKIRMNVIQAFVAKVHSDEEEMASIGDYMKPCLSALTQLVTHIIKRKLLDLSSSSYRQIFKCVDCAVSNLGSVGRNLKRHGDYKLAVDLLSRFWPVANVPELIPVVNFHESLAACYKERGELTKALLVMKQCAALDARLFTDNLLKLLVKIVAEKPVNLLNIFEPLADTSEQHAEILSRTAKVFLSSQQTPRVSDWCQKLLRTLLAHPGVRRGREKAVYKFLLAEHLWFHFPGEGEGCETILERCKGEPFLLAREALDELSRGEDRLYEDFFVQAGFLVWEMLNRAACLNNIAKMSAPVGGRDKHTAKPDPTTVTPPEPPDDKARRQCNSKTDLLINLNMANLLQAHKSVEKPQGVSGATGGCVGGDGKLDTGVGGESSNRKMLPHACDFQVDGDTLMLKASVGLELWTSWFKGRHQSPPVPLAELDNFRVDKSLGFLIKVADLAVLCQQCKPALEALSQARNFSILYNKPEVTKRVTGTLVSTLAQFGLTLRLPPEPEEADSPDRAPSRCEVAGSAREGQNNAGKTPAGESGGGSGNAIKDLGAGDVRFLEQLNLSRDCHVLQLTSLAFHHLRTGEAKKFLDLRAYILRGIEEQRKKGPLTPNCTLSLCAIHRYTAEFYASPAAGDFLGTSVMMGKELMEEAEPYAVESGSDSLKYIASAAIFYLGNKYKEAIRGVSVETWRLLHEYLTTLKLLGELYIHAGNIKYARTHLYEGLLVAESCLLNTWVITFTSMLAEIAFELWDESKEFSSNEFHLLLLHAGSALSAHRSRRNGRSVLCEHPRDDLCTRGTFSQDQCLAAQGTGSFQHQHQQEEEGAAVEVPVEICTCFHGFDAGKLREALSKIPEEREVEEELLPPIEFYPWQGEDFCGELYEVFPSNSALPASIAACGRQSVCRMQEPGSCELCHHPEMSLARVRLLCLAAEMGHRTSPEDKDYILQAFADALHASRRHRASPALEQLARRTLHAARLKHLSVEVGQYRQNEATMAWFTVMNCQARLHLKQLLPLEMAVNEQTRRDVLSKLRGENLVELVARADVPTDTPAPIRNYLLSEFILKHCTGEDEVGETRRAMHLAEDEAAKMGGQYGSSVMEATAKLMSVHLRYAPVLAYLASNDEMGVSGEEKKVLHENDGIKEVLQHMNDETWQAAYIRDQWDAKMMSRLNLDPVSFKTFREGNQPNGPCTERYFCVSSAAPPRSTGIDCTMKPLGAKCSEDPLAMFLNTPVSSYSYAEKSAKSTAQNSMEGRTGMSKKLSACPKKVLSFQSEEAKSQPGPAGKIPTGRKIDGSFFTLSNRLRLLNLGEKDARKTKTESARVSRGGSKENFVRGRCCIKVGDGLRGRVGRGRKVKAPSDNCSAFAAERLVENQQELTGKIITEQQGGAKSWPGLSEDREKRPGLGVRATKQTVDKRSGSRKTDVAVAETVGVESKVAGSKRRNTSNNKCKREPKVRSAGEVEEEDGIVLSTAAKLSRAVEKDISTESAVVCDSRPSVSRRGPARVRRPGKKGVASPELARQGDDSDDLCRTPDCANIPDSVLDRLALSSEELSSDSSFNSTASSTDLDSELLIHHEGENGLTSPACESELHFSSENLFHRYASFVQERVNQRSTRTKAFEGNFPIDPFSPLEIPRGRPQRKKADLKTVGKQDKEGSKQTPKTLTPEEEESKDVDGDDTEKENFVLCTPEREIGKSPFPLVTPRTISKSKLSLKKNTLRRAALVQREDSENILSADDIKEDTVKASRSRGVAGRKAEADGSGVEKKEFEFDETQESVKRKVSRGSRQRSARGCKSVGTTSTESGPASEVVGMDVADAAGGSKSPLKRLSEENIDSTSFSSNRKSVRQKTKTKPTGKENSVRQRTSRQPTTGENAAHQKTKHHASGENGVRHKTNRQSTTDRENNSPENLGEISNAAQTSESGEAAYSQHLGDVEEDSLCVESDSAELPVNSSREGTAPCNQSSETRQASPTVPATRDSLVDQNGLSSGSNPCLRSLFPSLQFHTPHLNVTDIRVLVSAIDQVKNFPPAFLYRQLCRSLAMLIWEEATDADCHCSNAMDAITALLVASMHVTYRHMLYRNLRSKLRKSQKMLKKKSGAPETRRAAAEEEPSRTAKRSGRVANSPPASEESSEDAGSVADGGAPAGETLEDAEADAASDEEWLGEEQLAQQRSRMKAALEDVAFNDLEVFTLKDYLGHLPPDYTVVQISIVDFDPTSSVDGEGQIFVSRMTSDLTPITVALPMERMFRLRRVLRLFAEQFRDRTDPMTSEEIVRIRTECDSFVRDIVAYLQMCVLGSHAWLLYGRVDVLRQPEVMAELDGAVTAVVTAVAAAYPGYAIDARIVGALLDVLAFANECEMRTLLGCVYPAHIVDILAAGFMDLQGKLLCGNSRLFGLRTRGVVPPPSSSSPELPSEGDGEQLRRGPVVLILDKSLTCLPWENLPCLLTQTVTRVPSFAALKVLLGMHHEKVVAPVDHGVDRSDAVAVVNPSADLLYSDSFLNPKFRQYRGWTVLRQKPPNVSDLRAILTEHSLYVYVGHGWGKQYVGGEDIQMFRGKAVAIVMGCKSSALEHSSRYDGDGGPLYFLLAGCPAMMGNLWTVTDRDIDKLTYNMVQQWMKAPSSVSLGESLTIARGACKLMGFNGFAPVIYGLPVQIVGRR